MPDAPKGFLQAVAETYYANEADNIDRYCFVFPNKRSATHFMQKLQDVATPPMILPGCTTISELVADQSEYVEASRLERMFILYNEYNKLMEEPVDFDRFAYWGDMLLNDFDDVDRYLVDADALFVNLKRFREIRSNYLTSEQIDVISRYWNGTEDLAKDIENFWQHTVHRREKMPTMTYKHQPHRILSNCGWCLTAYTMPITRRCTDVGSQLPDVCTVMQ